jgi:hypothetical protein
MPYVPILMSATSSGILLRKILRPVHGRKRIGEAIKIHGVVGDERVDAAGTNNQYYNIIRCVFISRLETAGKAVYQ